MLLTDHTTHTDKRVQLLMSFFTSLNEYLSHWLNTKKVLVVVPSMYLSRKLYIYSKHRKEL